MPLSCTLEYKISAGKFNAEGIAVNYGLASHPEGVGRLLHAIVTSTSSRPAVLDIWPDTDIRF